MSELEAMLEKLPTENVRQLARWLGVSTTRDAFWVPDDPAIRQNLAEAIARAARQDSVHTEAEIAARQRKRLRRELRGTIDRIRKNGDGPQLWNDVATALVAIENHLWSLDTGHSLGGGEGEERLAQ